MATFKKMRRCLTGFALCVLIGCVTAAGISAQEKETAGKGASASVASSGEEKTISFDFPDTDIRVAIETIAIKIGINIVAGPEVKGRISMKLDNVPWQKALDILLKTYGYGYVWDEGIVRVMSLENLKKEDMMTRVFTVSYGSPSEIARGINSLLSKEGKADANETARSIVVKDFPTNLGQIEKTIEKLDLLSKEAIAKKEGAKEAKEAAEEKVPEKEITLDFKDAPIREVIEQIAILSGVNITVGDSVTTKVTLSTGGKAVPWQKALEAILDTYDLGYMPSNVFLKDLKPGDFISIRTKNEMLAIAAKNQELNDTTEVEYVIYELKYIDAEDVKNLLLPQTVIPGIPSVPGQQPMAQPQGQQQLVPPVTAQNASPTPYIQSTSLLSKRGRVAVLTLSGQSGWNFNQDYRTGSMSASDRKEYKPPKSRKLLVVDVPERIKKVTEIIERVDVMPYQIMIEAKVIEVARDVLRDIGFEWGSGYNGIETGLATGQVVTQKISQGGATVIDDVKMGLQNLGYATGLTPASFQPDSTGLSPSTSGFKFKMEKLLNTQVEVILHMLEENVGANILSAPKIMTFSNQEATILIGTQYPIVTTSITTGTTATTTVQLDYYQNIGIRLSVVPQVSDKEYINMILHPAVTTSTSNLTIQNTGGFTIAQYPIIQTREADTQVLMKDGETIVIGGLLKDEKTETRIGVPFFQDLPFVGAAFRRTVSNTKKMDLLIFVTANIVLKNRERDGNVISYVISQKEGEQLLAQSTGDTVEGKKIVGD